MNSIKHTIQRIINNLGYKIVKINRDQRENDYAWKDFGAGWDTKRLKALSNKVHSIIDVGVAAGTPTLYDAFPNCHLMLIEPLTLFNEKIKKNLGDRIENTTILNCAVGDQETETGFTYIEDIPLQGSLFNRDLLKNGEKYIHTNVVVKKLDNIINETDIPVPYLVKIDVEGNELAAIQGAKETLSNTSVLIIEITLDGSYPSGLSTLREINEILSESGFILVDLADAHVLGSSGQRHVKKADFVYVNQKQSFNRI